MPPNPFPHPDDARRVRDEHFSSDDQLVTMALAVRGPHYTVRDVCIHDWKLARELGLRITVHVGDGALGRDGSLRWLSAEGLLADDTTYVHCNTLADDELVLIAESGGTASVAADVEMQMGHGFPATGRLLDVGIRPSLSIDVCSSTGGSMFSLMRTALGMQRALDNKAADEAGLALGGEPPRVSCRDMIEFATIEGARACGLEDKIGSLTPGKQADVVVIRADTVGMFPVNNPVGSLVYNAHIGLVDTVVVAGRIIKSGGVLLGRPGAAGAAARGADARVPARRGPQGPAYLGHRAGREVDARARAGGVVATRTEHVLMSWTVLRECEMVLYTMDAIGGAH